MSSDGKLFFVVRGKLGGSAIPDKAPEAWKWESHVTKAGQFKMVPFAAWDEIEQDYNVMVRFVREVLPYIGLKLDPDKPITREMIQEITRQMKEHNEKG